ncbi:MAG: hypothetical protein IPJ84_19705 [Bdellovibrionales bacterium]|nr:hypothetical protein [Bdellovibrionales bacterium]
MGNIVEFFAKVIFLGLVVSSVVREAPAADAIDLPAPGTQYTVGDKSLLDPLRPYDQLIDEQLKPKSGIAATEACKTVEAWRPTEISDATYHALVPDTFSSSRSRLGVFAVDRNVSCIQVGYPVRLALKQGSSGLYADVGWFMPTGLNPSPTIPDTQHGLIAGMAGLLGAMDRAIFVSGRFIFSETGNGLLRQGPKLDGVLAINREQVETAIQAGNFVLDVRTAKEFARSRVKGAVSAPYQLGRELNLERGPETFANQGDRFDLSKVTVAKDQPILVIGSDIFDLRPRRAALLLASRGYTRVYYFYEGMAYFQNMIAFPPTVSKQITVIDLAQLARLMFDPAIKPEIVDIRSRADFAAGYIPGAWSSVYKESDEFLFRRRGLSGDILAKVGDQFVVPNAIPQSAHIIIIGRDRRDFAGYKAGLVLKANGFSNVYWCRDGMLKWNSLGSEYSGRFLVGKSPELAQKTDAVLKTEKPQLKPPVDPSRAGTPKK